MKFKNRKLKFTLKNTSIKVKIFIYLIGFCSLLLVLLWLFQVVFLSSFYKNIKINEIKKSAGSIEDNINSADLQTLLDTIGESSDICIEIISEDGTGLYSSHVLRTCMIHKMTSFDIEKLYAKTKGNDGELWEYFSIPDFGGTRNDNKQFIGRVPQTEKSEQESIIYSQIITKSSGEKVLVALNTMVFPISSTVTTLRIQLYYVTGAMIIFSIFMALIIAKRVSKPIEAINNSAKALATGNYNVKFEGSGYKEISELSDTLNYAKNELSKVDALKGELIANISHDLRTPLTLISGYAEVMRDLPNENTPENAQIIVDETKRLTILVNDVLDISKLQSGTQTLNLGEYNLTRSISDIIEKTGALVKKDGFKLEFIYDKSVQIEGDETGIAQAFYNILTNGINYTGEDKRVMIKQTTMDELVRIEVSDTGSGIPEDKLPYIWDRYYKVDTHHKRAVTGTGLGLSIVKSIIDLHGGSYGVISKINGGSTFWFELKIHTIFTKGTR